MAHTYRLERTQFLPLPLDEVFPFFSDAGNLEAITPPSLHFHILTPRPIEMRSGALIDYRIRLFGVPMYWRTRIETWEPPHRFVDTQLRGPYKLWHHTHEFTSVPGGTQMIDRVDYELYLGPIGWMAHAAWVQRQLKQIFDYRREAVERLLIQPAAARS
ncbi:MAG: SRPBCC family protein [Pirellulaceae bacterium]|nr:SRPBCC family protein [Pirellulaceae bacterium]